jgi:quercetin dioxygenase-like cupin family protein
MEVATAVGSHNPAEMISDQGNAVCLIIHAAMSTNATTFYTPNDFTLQVGKIAHPAGSEIPRHAHRSTSRTIVAYSEVLLVQKGRMIIDIYNEKQTILCSRQITAGDVVIFVAGGHGFKFLEDTVLLEIKQGPYVGDHDKERF